jgi:hypothetical protein
MMVPNRGPQCLSARATKDTHRIPPPHSIVHKKLAVTAAGDDASRGTSLAPVFPPASGPGSVLQSTLLTSQPGAAAENVNRLQAVMDHLRAENERVARLKPKDLYLKVSDKGALSVYGLGRFPITLYRHEGLRYHVGRDRLDSFLDSSGMILNNPENFNFIEEVVLCHMLLTEDPFNGLHSYKEFARMSASSTNS